jgi:hypothetical protein
MILSILGCDQPGTLQRVADALADEAAGEATPAVGLLVSAAALVGEPCAADGVGGYTFVGEGARAFGVSGASVTTEEGSGDHVWDFGEVSFDGDVGDLTITASSTLVDYKVSFEGETSAMNADFDLLGCDSGNRASVSGEGHYTHDGETSALVIDGGASEKALAWSPSTAPVPSDGFVTWTSADEDVVITLDPAADIDVATRAWPGTATAPGKWTTEIELVLP